jgi:hypothetical protein
MLQALRNTRIVRHREQKVLCGKVEQRDDMELGHID